MDKTEDTREPTPPWSSDGPYGRSVREGQDPKVVEIYRAAGRGKVDPIGFLPDKPALAVTPITHNPYLQLPLSLAMAGVGWFLFEMLRSSPAGAIAAGGFFGAVALLVAFMSIRRIPAWHRARRLVSEYTRESGAPFPIELKWYR